VRSISVDIGHVVLDGVGVHPRNPDRFGTQVEVALGRFLEQGPIQTGCYAREIPEISGLSIDLPEGASDEQIASALARALHRSLLMVR
jgi:hypothetical protein